MYIYIYMHTLTALFAARCATGAHPGASFIVRAHDNFNNLHFDKSLESKKHTGNGNRQTIGVQLCVDM